MYSGSPSFFNNTLINNKTVGISIGSSSPQIFNNTILQSGGTAILAANSNAATVKNNVFQLTGGIVFNANAVAVSLIASDYNLFDLEGAATFANWAGQAVADFNAWHFGTGLDTHSLTGNPQFTDAAHGNYILAPTSPGIDAGDPGSPFSQEPGFNGGRVNLGMEGNTARATQSASQVVQVLGPNGLDKLETGQPATITFRTDGVSGLEAAALLNSGGANVAGTEPGQVWLANSISGLNSTSTSATIDTSGSPLVGPAALYADSIAGNAGVGNKLTQAIGVADGNYIVNLHFAEYYFVGVGARLFDIRINGVLVATNFDIYAQAGNAINKAVVASFAATATGGTGIVVELTNKTFNSAFLAAVEVDKVTPPAAQQTAKVEASPDNGQTWQLVAAAAPIDGYGYGSVSWTPNFITAGNTALVRVTANGVSSVSNQGFTVANAGHDYFINDNSTIGDEYTSAVGNDLNSGKTPDAPMASLAALVRAYTLGPGDIVHIDTGSYTLLTDVTLDQTDSGTGTGAGQTLTFQGPTAHLATLNRANNNANGFLFTGADDVTISNLTITGADTGIRLATGAGSNAITVSHVDISTSKSYGVYVGDGDDGFLLDSSRIFGAVANYQNTGVYLYSAGATQTSSSVTNTEIFGQHIGIDVELKSGLIDSNSIHDNSGYGIYAYNYYGTGQLTVSNNRVFNNGNSGSFNYGVYAYGINVLVTGNHIFGQTATGDVGLAVINGAVAKNNDVYGNYDGIYTQDMTSLIAGNRIFSNTDDGILVTAYGALITGNRIYSNKNGIAGTLYTNGRYDIENNLIYANTVAGIDIGGGGNQPPNNKIIGNTIYQSVGTGVKLSASSVNTTLADNIIWGDLGTLVSISADSLTGFSAGYNLYYRGTNAAATLASFGGSTYANLAAWQAAVATQNAGSLEGDPKFIDINGADNVFGGLDTALGGGADDNFTPGKFSPAIDASSAFLQSATDMLGQARRDDPAVGNTGVGQPVYDETAGVPNAIPTGTAAPGFLYTAGYSSAYNLPFAFSFYGTNYSTIYLTPSGALFFAQTPAQNSSLVGSPSVAGLQSTAMIAPFWGAVDMRFYYVANGDGAYVDTSVPNYVTIRFAVTPTTNNNSSTPPSIFAVRLGADGSIRFDYGANLDGVTPVIGVSAGNGLDYSVSSISGLNNLSNHASVTFTPNISEGRTYYDIGALEFEGSSADTLPPTIVSGINLPANGTSTDAAFSSITLNVSETLDLIGANSAANYQLVEAGADKTFDTPDDTIIALTPSYASGSKSILLSLGNGVALADGSYRLSVSKTGGLLDTAGNALDGDGDGNAGGAFTRFFTIDRSANHAPVIFDASASVAGDQSLSVTLHATDADNDPITFAIVTAPKHGAIQNFDPSAGTFTYVPNYGYVGSDTIRYAANDPKLGHSEANFVINVTPTNHAPVASDVSANAIAGQPLTLTLQGSDLETAANQLTLLILTQPAHGAVTITGQNTVSYTAALAYQGADSFTYAWRDNGAPAGSSSNVLTSAAATVSLTVTKISHAPATAAATVAAVENGSYTFKLADFPFSDPNDSPANSLKAVIFVTTPAVGLLTDAGAAVTAAQSVLATDIAAGKLVFTPAAGGSGALYASFQFEVRDDGGTANGGLDTSAPAVITLNVAPINSAPSTANVTVSTTEGTAYVFKTPDFAFTDPNDTPPNTLQSVLITSLPTLGSLSLNSVAVSAGQAVLAADIAAGKLVYTPGVGSGASYASFGFEVVDNGGTANGGHDTSAPATVTVSVTAVLSVTVSGTAQEGQTLTANPSGAVTGYQWQASVGGTWSNITGATSSTYLVQEADEGSQLRVHVTSIGGPADSAATASVTDIAPTLTAPVISGVAQEGQTLTATAAVANDSDATVSYQWQADHGTGFVSIAGATGLSYVVQEADEGARLQIVATSTDGDGSGTTATSAPTASVTDIAPTLTAPVISGVAQEGQTLTATAAVANDSDATVSYQWQADHGTGFVSIAGATGLSYVVQEADEGARLQIVATSTDGDGSGTTATSAPTASVTDIAPTLTAPVISGVAQEGQTLTATAAVANDSDATVSYQWQADHGTGFVSIAGATGLSYVVQEADEGARLQIVATSTDGDGSGTTATSAPTASVTDIAPTLTAPVISGVAQEGQTLTATAAVANDSDATVSYQWQADHGTGFVSIAGATGLSYVVQSTDVGSQIQLVATSTDSDGSGTTTTSAPTGTVTSANVLSVTVSGTAQEGQTLTANPSGAVTGYQWQASVGGTWSNITGATSSTYLVQEADEGSQLRVHVTSIGGPADSAATASVTDIAPTLTAPVISGVAQEGQTLTATAAVANDSDATVSYQWQADHGTGFVSIAGATGLSYVVQEADEGARLQIVATSTDGDGSGTTATSAPTASVTDIAPTLTAPVISGVAQEGQTLTATAAVANDSDATVSYQWQADHGTGFVSIAGATGLSYVVQEADEGARLQIVATSTDGDGSGTTATSAPTASVTDIAPTLTAPVISGVAQEGQTLTATAAVANDSDATVSYQWQADHGTGFVSIAGATGLSYVVQSTDVGSQIQLVATSTDSDGSGTTTTSAPTGTVTSANVLSVTVSGTAQEGQTLTANPSGAVTGYQWQASVGGTWSNITGATSSTYLVQEADEGSQLRVHVTSIGGPADSAATASVTDIAPTLTAPVISGVAQEGQTLTATAAVANDSDATVSYQWQADHGTGFVSIAGATGLSYVVQEADEGARLQIVATSTDGDGSGTTATSAPTASVTDIAPTLTAPVISGVAQEGQTLTATAAVANDSDATVSYQWQADHGTGFVSIAGATGLSYVVQEADEGARLQIVATSTDGDGSGTTATSAPTASVTDIAPTLTAPVISGVAQEGQTLTATAAVANDSDATVSYQWQADHGTGFVSIAGATGLSYVVQEADEGARLQIVATSTDGDGSGTTATSAPTASVTDIAPTLTAPVISGVAQEGQTLTATAAVANDSDATVSYQWQADHGTGFVSIAGATGLSYVVQSTDVGSQIQLVATSTDSDGSGTTTTSAPTGTVTSANVLSVTVSGTAQEGQTLTANPSGAVTGYQWQASVGGTWSNITGATSSTYLVQEADEGSQLRVHVTSIGGPADSAATASVTDIAPTLTAPVISGVAQEGQTLTATAAVANDSDATVSYQWQADHGTGFVSIAGATGLSYVVQEADEGARLQIVATSTDGDGSGTTATSAPTASVTDIAPALTAPVISGVAQEGQTLTATAAVANDSDATVSYQWQADHGTGFVSIAGATGLSYVVQEADEGARLQIVATSTDGDGSGTTATSAPTASVTDIALAFSTPASITGTAKEGEVLTAVAGKLNDSDASVTGYQWTRDGVNINGATASTYAVTEADETHLLRVVETATDADGGPTTTSTSSPTSAVIDATPTLSVTISGAALDGQTLKATGIANSGDATISYQWQVLNNTTWRNINGATSSSYLVTEANEGHQLRVVVTSLDPDGGGASATSAATAIVTDPAPTLTIGSSSLFVPAHGAVLLPISVSGFDVDDRVTVTITGLSTFETITVGGSNQTFAGSSLTFTAAQITRGLTLHSTFVGSGQPENILTVTATNATAGEGQTSPAQTIAVTVNAVIAQPVTITTVKDTNIFIPVSTLLTGGASSVVPVATISSVGNATNGTVAFNQTSGTIVFTPNAGFVGNATFTYTIISGKLTSSAAVTVNVTAAAAPRAVAGVPAVIRMPAAQTVNIKIADLLGSASGSLIFEGVLQTSVGTVTVNANTGIVSIAFVGPVPRRVVILFSVGDGRTALLHRTVIRLANAEVKAPQTGVSGNNDEAEDAAIPVETEGRTRIANVAASMPAYTPGNGAAPATADKIEGNVVQIALEQKASPEQINKMMGEQPQRSDLMQALFAGGIILPAMMKRGKARTTVGNETKGTRPGSLFTFDSDTDRLLPENAEVPAAFDLPSIIESSVASDEDGWVYIKMDAAE